MPRYIVKVSQPEAVAAKRIADAIRTIGSHFATHADWRRKNDLRIGSLVVEANVMWDAVGVVPPNMRAQAAVFLLEPVTARVERATPSGLALQPIAVAA